MNIVPALSVPVSRQIELFNASFEGYLAGFHPLDEKRFGGLLRSGGIDLSRSLIALDQKEQPAGLAYATVYAGKSRLAGMGVAPAFRRQGYARFLLDEFIAQSKERGSSSVELEVFEKNTPAVDLYRNAGFETLQRLYGYRWDQPPAGSGNTPCNENLGTFLQANLNSSSYPEPYQFSPYALISEAGDLQIKRLQHAWIAYKITPDNKVLLKYVADAEDDTEAMKKLVWTVACGLGDLPWTVPQIVPEQIALQVLEPLGFERLQLNQIQMVLNVDDRMVSG